MRCIPDDENHDVCQRCARSGRSCVFTPLQKRKQRKRTDTRVAELEREMRQMRAMLRQKEEEQRSNSQSQPEETGTQIQARSRLSGDGAGDGAEEGERSVSKPASSDNVVAESNAAPSLWPKRLPDRPVDDAKDVVDSGMISMATARHLFETCQKDLFPHYPLVYIPPGVTAEVMRKSQPTLFLAIISAASMKENPELSSMLDQELVQSYATRSLVRSEKSLELVQALIISGVWYNPPTKFGQLKYYEYISMATAMAMDIGIGSRPPRQRARYSANVHSAEGGHNSNLSMAQRFGHSSPDSASVEARRTFLACYLICSSVSLSLRRPSLLKVNSYIRDCLDFLDQSPDAVPSDRTLVAWARMIMIAEEISTSFCYDDLGNMGSIAELPVRMMLKDYSSRLTLWYENVPEMDAGTAPMLIMMYYSIRMLLYEIVLYVDHSPEDFRAPYQMGGIYPDDSDEIPTQTLTEGLVECISSSHALLDVFLAIDATSLRALPVFTYVRVSFAGFVLAKLSLSAVHPRSRLGKVLDHSSLKAESYMDRMILHARNIAGPSRSRVPSIFLALLFKLRQWCLHPTALIDEHEESFHEMISRTAKSDPHLLSDRMAFEGPRVFEYFSSSEDSPHTVDEATAGNASAAHGTKSRSTSVMTSPQEAFAFQYNQPTNSDFTPMMAGVPSHPANASSSALAPVPLPQPPPPAPMMPFADSNYTNPPSSSYTQVLNQMSLDDTLMSFIGDMTLPEGGLTGLDDWSMPPDLSNMNQMDVMNWQFPNPNGQ